MTSSKIPQIIAASMEYAKIGFPKKGLIFFLGIRLLPPRAVIIANVFI